MTILGLILTLIVIGVGLWLVGFIPMDGRILQIIRGVAILFVILWLVSVFAPGAFGSVGDGCNRPVTPVVHSR